MAAETASLDGYCHFSRLPRELRDRIYDFTCADHTSLVLVTPSLFTQVLFSDLPELPLLGVCSQIREEVLLSVARRTSATTLDAWDSNGAYDPLQRKNKVPRAVLERVRDLEVVLPTWSPTYNDLSMVEAVLNYVRGVEHLTIMFNNPSLATVKIQELKGCEVTRHWNAGTKQHDLRFRRSTSKPVDADQQNEELLLRRWMTKEQAAAKVSIKGYVSGKWSDEGMYSPGHYAEF